jgi:hypothetical protein
MKYVVATDSSNNFFVGWTLAGSTWLLTHTDSLCVSGRHFFYKINQKKDKKEDIYVLLFDESLIQQLKKTQLDIQAILELSYKFK